MSSTSWVCTQVWSKLTALSRVLNHWQRQGRSLPQSRMRNWAFSAFSLEIIREWVLERGMVLSGSSRSQLEISSRTILFVKVKVIRKHKMHTVPLLQIKCSLFWPHCLLNTVCLRPEEALRCSGTGVTRDL